MPTKPNGFPPHFPLRWLGAALLLVGLCQARLTSAYIDMPAERLTLPRLLLEFRNVGLYGVDWVDAEHRAVRYRLVEAIQGNPEETFKHIINLDGRVPEELKELAEGEPAVVLGPDEYSRG